MQTKELVRFLDTLLEPQKFKDYAPNGLQVEGRANIRRLAVAVSCNEYVIKTAADMQADALLVHHGMFWKGDNPCITGYRHKRISSLIKSDMNLIAYHLPLDAHDIVGNNACIGRALGVENVRKFGEMDLGRIGTLSSPMYCKDFLAALAEIFGTAPNAVGDTDKVIRTVAWCSGSAYDMLEDAALAGADIFISGEIAERTMHLAYELGTVYANCGHAPTEQFGVQALGNVIADRFGIEVHYIPDPNKI